MKNATLSAFIGWPHRLAAALLLLLAGLFASLTGRAQVANYVFSQSTRPYVPLSTTSSTQIVRQVPGTLFLSVTRLPVGAIPFPFVFNGQPYTRCYVHSRGYITFGDVRPAADTSSSLALVSNRPLSISTPYDGAIAPLAGYLGGSFSPPFIEIRYETLGTAPNRIFVVDWRNVYSLNAGGPFNFQIRLHETTNVIDFAYGLCQAQALGYGEVGLRGFTPTDFNNRRGLWPTTTPGLQARDTVVVRAGSVPTNGLLYTYTPPAPLPCAQPFSLAADTLGPTSLYLSWRLASGGGSGPFTVRYGPTGFNPATPGAGFTATAPAGATGVRVSGLSVFTRYDFYVTQNCGGAAGSSPASVPGRFRTTLSNDDPNVAEVLPIGTTCVPVPGTTFGANTSPPNGYPPSQVSNGCSPILVKNDVWYTITTPATGPASQAVRISTIGQGAGQIMLLSSANGSAGPFTALACVEFGNNAANNGADLTYSVAPNTTYYVRVAGDYFQGPFTICASVVPGCGQPLNATLTNLTATTALLSFTPSAGSPSSYTVTATVTGGPSFTVSPAPTASPVLVTGLTPGTRYSIDVRANCGALGQSAPLQFPVYFITPPVNDSLSQAQALPLLPTCQPVPGTVQGSTRTPNTGLDVVCTSGPTDGEVWYTFTTDATGPASTAARLEVSSTSGFVVSVGAGSPGSPFTFVNCAADTRTTPALDLTGLLPATTYYVRVRRKTLVLLNYTFSICARHPLAPVACPAPVNLTVGNLTATSAQVSWLIPAPFPAPAAGYVVSYRAQNGPAVPLAPAPTASPAGLTGLVPGTTYTVRVQSDCGPAGRSLADSISFRTPGPPPNDLCFTATALACGQTLAGSAIGATRGGQPATACQGLTPGSAGVWYVVQGTGQTVTLRTCQAFGINAPYMATQLSVYTGSCGALTCVAASARDTSCTAAPTYANLAAVSFAAQAGQPYYVLVSNAGNLNRDFVLSASCGPLAVRNAGLAAQVSLFPNPAHHAATLTLPTGLTRRAVRVTLYNALGQAVRTYPAISTSGPAELDLMGLAAGVYQVRLLTAEGAISKRLLVE